MKKTLVSALTTALVVGAASTTFAAANPFSDVPADHWAYDAVSQLAADGVIEGYGDTTFRGNQNITRYEMAQMIAKAMAKTDASAADKALIDKLAAEFSDELNNLGVRVSNLERNADMVKWNGLVEYTYTSTRHDTNTSKKVKNNDDDLVFRLEPKAEVNKNWDVHARLDADIKLDTDKGGNDDGKVVLKRVWAEGHYDNFNVKLGKLPNAINLISTTDDPYSGAAVMFGNDLKVTLEAGRIDATQFGDMGRDKDGLTSSDSNHIFAKGDDTVNFQAINLGYAKNKFYGNTGYEHMDGATLSTANLVKPYTNSNDKEYKANIWFVNAGYCFDHNNFFKAEYAQNTEADNYDNAYSFEYDYKGAQPQNKGSWGMYLAYRNLGQYAAPWSTYGDGVDGGQKGIEVGTSYTLFQNVQLFAKYFNGKDIAADKDAQKLFGRVDVFF